MTGFRGFNNTTIKRILDELETVYLRLRKTEVEGVAVVEFRANNGTMNKQNKFYAFQ